MSASLYIIALPKLYLGCIMLLPMQTEQLAQFHNKNS